MSEKLFNAQDAFTYERLRKAGSEGSQVMLYLAALRLFRQARREVTKAGGTVTSTVLVLRAEVTASFPDEETS